MKKIKNITVGGIKTKIIAALIANSAGIPCWIGNLKNKGLGTMFCVTKEEAIKFLESMRYK